jgi:phosphate starvation-inducible protein PhoH
MAHPRWYEEPMTEAVTIRTLAVAEAEAALPELLYLLRDAVEAGASVGFLPPLADTEGRAYWRGVIAAIADGSRVLLVAKSPSCWSRAWRDGKVSVAP